MNYEFKKLDNVVALSCHVIPILIMPSYKHYKLRNRRTGDKEKNFEITDGAGRRILYKRGVRTTNRPIRKSKTSTVKGAQNKLKQFKQASILAVAVTGILLLILAPGEAGYSQEAGDSIQPLEVSELENSENSAPESLLSERNSKEELAIVEKEDFSKAAKNEALNTFRNLWEGLYSNLPKILVAIVTLFLAWLLVKLVRLILSKTINRWSNSDAIITLSGIAIWLLAMGMAVSVVAGDIRALVGSLGLVGLALSWSLQTPIESFTAWLQNSFQRYYRVGDRISVGEVFGDVYKIDFLTTTVWEIGAPYKPGFVQAEQPTGRLVTFPNSEILTGTVVNLTKDFPFVWDELTAAVANESDVRFCMKVIDEVASNLMGNYMQEPASKYTEILKKARLDYKIAVKPEVFVSMQESWTDISVRYLVGARDRRRWKSDLNLELTKELSKKEYGGKIIPVYPRQQLQFIHSNGLPVEPDFFKNKPTATKD